MTDLRGQSDVSRDAHCSAAGRRRQWAGRSHLREGRLETGVARWERMRGASCAAGRCSGSRSALIVLFRRDGGLPAAVHQQGPELRRPDEGAAIALAGGLVRLRHPGLRRLCPHRVWRPSLDQRGHSCHGVHPGLRVVRWASSPVTVGGWLDSVIGRIAEIFLGDPDLPRRDPVPLSRSPTTIDTPFAIAVGKVAFVHRDPWLADDHAADARQRAPGQAERLRASSPGAGRLALADHRRPHPAQLGRLGDRCFHHQPWRLHFRRGYAVLPGSRSAAARHLVGQS